MFGHTFYSWPTFYCAGNQLFTACPLLEFQSTFVFTEWHSPFHKSPKLFLYLGIVQLALNHPSVHLHAENGEDQLQLLTEYYGDHLQAEEGENQVQLIQNARLVTCMQKWVKNKSNFLQNAMEITYR